MDDGKATYEVLLDGRREVLSLDRSGDRVRVRLPGRSFDVDVVPLSDHSFSLILEGRSHDVTVSPGPEGFQVHVDGVCFQVGLGSPRRGGSSASRGAEAVGALAVTTPMPGKVVRILVAEGDRVRQGQGLLVVEAMKMQNELASPKAGTIRRIHVSEDQAVHAGEPLVVVE